MTFKQAKELIEKIELTELGLRKTIKYIEKATAEFHITLKKQEDLLKKYPETSKYETKLKVSIAFFIGLSVGMIIGAIVSKL